MNRRTFLKTASMGIAGALAGGKLLHAALPKMKITRVRFYETPISRPHFNQSFHIVTVETDQGITGIGEGGSRDTIRQCAEMVIGEDPSRIDYCFQLMTRGRFYPPGREIQDAVGAVDMALWDIKGKALGVPVWQLLGGKSRDHIECYSTGFPSKGSLKETARACVEYGYRAFRTSVSDTPAAKGFNSHQMVRKTYDDCVQIREGVGKDGDWAIDYHTRLDLSDAVRMSTLIEPLEPYFCEDMVRSEDPDIYKKLRTMVKVPIAVGEHYGTRWDTRDLIENQLIDYSRVTIPNVGGISEYAKIASLAETHFVGLTPHFTGPVAEASLVHVITAFSGPAMMEMTGIGGNYKDQMQHLPECFDFRAGKLYANDRPGLGVTFDATKVPLTAEFTTRNQPIPMLRRPDGSFTNW
jgi:galactonate dehydratase